MQKKADGQNYAPVGKFEPVCPAGAFRVAVIGLDHGHIFGMCNGLLEAGATLVSVYDPDPQKVEGFLAVFEGVVAAESEQAIYDDPSIQMIACASVPIIRGDVAVKAMEAGKDFFGDKPPCANMAQLDAIKATVAKTEQKFFVYFSERLHVEASVYAQQLINDGAIGKVIQVMGFGPHRLNAPTRPAWFFDKDQYGGILVDIGCHQIEQIINYAGAKDATITHSRIANYNNKDHENFDDYGDAMVLCDNGVTGYFKVDWFTPAGLGAWGDGRTIITGTDGFIEIRKYINLATDGNGDHVFYANHTGEYHYNASGICGFPFFGKMIRDCLDRTQTAMTQESIYKPIELAIIAQNQAVDVSK